MLPAVTETDEPDSPVQLLPIADVSAIVLDDCVYRLMILQCIHCGKAHFRVSRHAGVFYTLYIPPEDFEASDFETYCRDLHENMRLDRHYVLSDVRDLISQYNSPSGIESDGSYLDQLMDFARLRLRALKENGDLQRIEHGDPEARRNRSLAMAFELGYAASELRLRDAYEDAIFEGMRLQEGRETGRIAAAQAKERATRKTREAITAAARELYAENPRLSPQ